MRNRWKPSRNALLASIALVSATYLARGVPALRSIGEPEVAWDRNGLEVCWVDDPAQMDRTTIADDFPDVKPEILEPFNAREKKIVQDVLAAEYRLDTAGIVFDGFQPCSKRPDADAYLFTSTRETVDAYGNKSGKKLELDDGDASIGQNGISHDYWKMPDGSLRPRGEGLNDGEDASPTPTVGVLPPGPRGGKAITRYDERDRAHKAYVFLLAYREPRGLATTNEFDLRMTALHEFGHLAGLRHEHIRAESARDPGCALAGTDLKAERPDDSTRAYSAYDPNSVMNYCYLQAIAQTTSDRFILSDHDDAGDPLNGVPPHVSKGSLLLRDKRVIARTKLPGGEIEVSIRAGLSEKDLRALRCLYRVDSPAVSERLCKPARL